jgi:hypothetical protein
MGKDNSPPLRPTPLFEAQARREAPVSPSPRAVILTHVFTPEGRGAGFQVTLPDYQAVSCLVSMKWVKNPAVNEYRPDGNYSATINTDTVLMPPDGAANLLPEMTATLVFLNDGNSFMTWHEVESMRDLLVESEKTGLRMLERMSGTVNSYALESLARDTIAEPLSFHVTGTGGQQQNTLLILRNFRDIHYTTKPQWEKSPDGKYRPVGVPDAEIISFDPGQTPESEVSLDSLLLVTLQSGKTLICMEEYPGEFNYKLERAQSDSVTRLATFMKNVSPGNGLTTQPQTQPQANNNSALAFTEELDM